MKELNTQLVMEFIESCRENWKIQLFECPPQESHSKFPVTNKMDEDAGMRP
jgi:hypothetical protein